jgi:hypothetical protein
MDFKALAALLQGSSPVQKVEGNRTRGMPNQPGFNNGPFLHPEQVQQLQMIQKQYGLGPEQMRALIDQVMKERR